MKLACRGSVHRLMTGMYIICIASNFRIVSTPLARLLFKVYILQDELTYFSSTHTAQ